MNTTFNPNGEEFIVVVGSAKGIGSAVVQHLFHGCGQNVLALDKVYGAEFMGKASEGSGGMVVSTFLDAEEPVHRLNTVRTWLEMNHASVKGLVYCIGNNKLVWLGKGATEVAEKVFKTNVIGIFAAIEGLMPVMTKDCRVVLFSSIAGEIPMRTTAPYCATKAAVNMMTKCLAREMAPRPVFCVMPGPTDGDNSYLDTERQINALRGWPMEKVRQMTLSDIPMGKLATEQECADATEYCLLKAPSHASGMTYRLTGGR